jgi:hypothetical protein
VIDLFALTSDFHRNAIDPAYLLPSVKLLLTGVDLIVSMAFVSGGARALRGDISGIAVVRVCAVSAIVLTFIGAANVMAIFVSRSVIAATEHAVLAVLRPFTDPININAVSQMFPVFIHGTEVIVVVTCSFQFAYYFCLYRAMTGLASANFSPGVGSLSRPV